MKKIIAITTVLLLLAGTLHANPPKKSWEIGAGISAYQFNRIAISDIQINNDIMYFGINSRNFIYGGNIYAARELNKYFFVDAQGVLGAAKKTAYNSGNRQLFYDLGIGLQWRLGEYFHSKYVDPFVRVGGSYFHKSFDILYTGATDHLQWDYDIYRNKEGVDKNNLFTAKLGLGVNMWLTDRFGLGVQGDYVHHPYKDVQNSLQATARVLFRIGGKTKKTAPTIEYIEVPVEMRVEVPVEVPVEIKVESKILELFNSIHFDFDLYTLKTEYKEVIEQISAIMLNDTSKRYLITGYTDTRGSASYNQTLSENRARAIRQALIDQGVPATMIKAKGVGKRTAHAPYQESHHVREGDRKVNVELVTNEEYWNIL